MLPSLFVSHGAPDLVLHASPARAFLSGLADVLPARPEAILVASAHWETAAPAVSAPALNRTIYDFGGFPSALYQMTYPAPGAPELAARAAALLAGAGYEVGVDPGRGLDHGAWVPLSLAFPAADIPTAQISLQTARGPAHALAIGRALAPLRAEGVLLVGSGSFTHDLSEYRAFRHVIDAPEPDWVAAFAEWMTATLADGRTEDLLAYRTRAPHAAKNHPTEEHLLPLFLALGAGGAAGAPRHLHASATHGVLRMDVYAFGDAP